MHAETTPDRVAAELRRLDELLAALRAEWDLAAAACPHAFEPVGRRTERFREGGVWAARRTTLHRCRACGRTAETVETVAAAALPPPPPGPSAGDRPC